MKKSSIQGWRDVFSFQLVQTMKGKSYLITTAILCFVALASFPLLSLLMGGEGQTLKSIRTVYVLNESILPVEDFSGIRERNESYKEIEFKIEERTLDEVTNELKEAGKEDAAMLLHITWEEEGYFSLNFVTGTKSGVKEKDVRHLSEGVAEYFDVARLGLLDVTKEQMEYINTPVETHVVNLGESGDVGDEEEKNQGITLSQYYIVLGGVVLLIFIISFSGSSIALSIITEKSTRVIEYLLTSIRPLSIIFGKILSVLTSVIIQVALVGLCAGASTLVSAIVLGMDTGKGQNVGSMVRDMAEKGELSIRPLYVLVGIAIIICGFLFYGTLAGLAGATVSKMEEMGEGLKAYNTVMVIGAYMGIGLGMAGISGSGGAGVSAYQAFCYLFPLSSPFVLPTSLLIGKVSLGWALGGLSLLVVSLTFLFWFVARVYEGMILYNGNRIKWKEILSFSKEGRGAR